MSLKLGTSDISKLYLGSTEITKAYLGSNLVYGGVRTYDITQVDSLIFDASNSWNSLALLASGHFALQSAGVGSDGFVRTFSFDGSFDNLTELDELEHDTAQGTFGSAVRIDDTHFAVAYASSGNDGFIKVFSVDGSYNITQETSLEHDTVNGTYNSLVQIDATHFILAYAGPGNDGFIKTFSMDGSFNMTELDSLEHNTTAGIWNSFTMIDSTNFVLAYAGSGSDGYVSTFSIDGSYNITQIDSIEHDTSNSVTTAIVLIDSTHFAVAYGDTGGIGVIKTFSMDASKDNITQLDSVTYDATRGDYPSLAKIDDTHLLMASRGDDSGTIRGYIRVFELDGSYNLTEIKTLNHSTNDSVFNSLVSIDANYFGLAYNDLVTGEGILKTFNVS